MRNVNGIQLLNLIRESGPVSRATLARISSLSKPTTSEQVGRLISLGYVVEIGPGGSASTGGKRPTLVAFNGDAGRVAGVSIGPEMTQIALADLQGKVLLQTELRTSPDRGPKRLLDRILRALASLVAKDANGGRTLRAVGVGVPGRIDCVEGKVLESGSVFGWKDVAVAGPIQRSLGCPVLVDNDVNAALLAELNHGGARDADTAVLIRVDVGIGSAVAMHRRIHHGCHWAAGEIGHLAPDKQGMRRISPRGQLESMVGTDQVAKRVRAAAKKSARLRRLLQSEVEMPALFAAAGQGESIAIAIASDIAHHLSVAAAHLALAYDPDVVLLSGEVFQHVISDIRKFFSRTIPWSPVVRQAGSGEEGVRIGAVDMALIAVYQQMSREMHRDVPPARTASAGA